MSSEMSKSPDSPGRTAALELCKKATRLYSESRFDDAIAAVTEAIEQFPDCFEAYQLRAHLRFVQQDWPEYVGDVCATTPGRIFPASISARPTWVH